MCENGLLSAKLMLHRTEQPENSNAAPLMRPALFIISLLCVVLFWGGILIAKWLYPAEFDWRYMTLSTLLSPRRNPDGHLWAAGGVVLSSLCALCWAVALRFGSDESSAQRAGGIPLVIVGSICMAASVLLPWRLPRLPKEHEILTLFAFAGLCLGMIRLAFQTAGRFLRRRVGGSARRLRLYGAALASVAVFPIFVAGLAEAYVFYVLPQLHWVNLAWRAQGVSMYLSFAFWEWITCAMLSSYIAILSIAVQSSQPSGASRSRTLLRI
jgi:hypothetical protein